MDKKRSIGVIVLLSALLLSGCSTVTDMADTPEFPSYVVINDPTSPNKDVLRRPAETVTFPLSQENKDIIAVLAKKFDKEENCAGLAAPQIGFNKRIIIFAVPDDPELKKWHPDLTETMKRTIWINPTYEPVGKEKSKDYEGCFSVHDLAGAIPRFKTIRYTAYTPEGQLVKGIAHGFLARVIQHEVDHINGKLFIDYVSEGKLFSISEFVKQAKGMKAGDAS